MRWRGWFSGGRLLAVLTVANLALGVGFFTLRPPGRQVVIVTPPELPAQIRELGTRMDGKHRDEPYTLVLSDADLAAAIAYFLATSPDVPFTNVRVAVTGGRVIVNGTSRGAAVAVPVRATLTVSARAGQPVVRVENVSLGATPLLGIVRRQIIDQANASLDLSRYDLGVTVESLTLGEGTLTVRGKLT